MATEPVPGTTPGGAATSAGLLRPLRIGSCELPNNLILAPMAGVSDRPYRTLCRRLGAGLAVSEMVSSDTSLWGARKSVRRLDFAGEDGPLAVQILGSDPAAMAEAARVNLGLGARIIDINMGCPAPKVCRAAAGSALLQDEPLVGRILAAVVRAAGPAPVTLKVRTGWSPERRNARAIARLAWESGISALAVHGRTRACGYDTPAEHETVSQIRSEVPILLIANGDIDSPQTARRVLNSTGCDAIMLGRAAQGRPWVFRDIADFLATGVVPAEPPRDWIRGLLLEHLDMLYGFYGTGPGVRIARKHIAWYCRGLPGAAAFRDAINRVDGAAEQVARVTAFFDHEDPAREDGQE